MKDEAGVGGSREVRRKSIGGRQKQSKERAKKGVNYKAVIYF